MGIGGIGGIGGTCQTEVAIASCSTSSLSSFFSSHGASQVRPSGATIGFGGHDLLRLLAGSKKGTPPHLPISFPLLLLLPLLLPLLLLLNGFTECPFVFV